MGLNILILLVFILVLVLVLCIIKINIFNGKMSGGSSASNGASKSHTDQLITMDIKLPHISEELHILPIIGENRVILENKYANPLPPHIKNKFWAFYPLTHFQSFMFKKPLQLNEYHLRVIEQNPQFKSIIADLLNKDLFAFPSINLGIFSKYKQFSAPKLRYLQIGSPNNNDNELLALYRQSHISIKDKYEYIFIGEKIEELATIKGVFNIIYFDLMDHYVLYKLLFHFSHIIDASSLVIIQLVNYNSQFMIDIITILQYIFKSVHIIRTIMNLDLYQTRSIVCEHFDIIKFKKILLQLNKFMDKDHTLFIQILKNNSENEIRSKSSQILIDISETIEKNRLDHINEINQLMDFVCSEETNEIDLNKLKTIQDSEKLKAINILNLLKIKPNFSLLFSIKDVDKFMKYDYPLSVQITNSAPILKYEELHKLFVFLESELFLHKAYLHRVEWKKFKMLDTLFRRTKLLKQILRDKKIVHKSWLLSQAYFKMMEILHEGNLCNLPQLNNSTLPQPQSHPQLHPQPQPQPHSHPQPHNSNKIINMRAFHICEAPGQFIKSCQKYVEVMNKRGVRLSYEWNAQSLRATDQNTALDDVYGFLSDPQMKDKWLYGADHTGDITSYENILNYEQISKTNGGYNIVTSDCGIQFSIYEFQEEEIEYINYSQFITMLLCLQKGGSCAMKVFLPLARPMALYMGHLLFEYFETVIYFKPSLNLTSSEIYLIGKGYKTIPGEIRNNILALHKNKSIEEILPNLHMDNNYLINIKKHYDSCNKLVFNSISCINKYLFFYNYMEELNKIQGNANNLNKIQGNSIEKKLRAGLYQVSEKWIKKYFM